jgi:hypothetical protein
MVSARSACRKAAGWRRLPTRAGLLFSAVSTEDSVLLGFGIEQIESAAERAAVLGKALKHLLPSTM